LPNIGDEFATVDWRKCQDEFTKNVELFLTSKDAHHFKSGTAEEHTVWQDLMEEITQLMYPDELIKFKRNNIPTNPIAFSCIFAPANAPFPIHGNPEFHKKTICGKKFHKLDLWKN